MRVPHESRLPLLLSSVASGVSRPVLHRHLPILRRCVGSRERPLIVASCARSDQADQPGRFRNLLLLTKHRLVVTSELGLFRRLRLHLNVGLNQLLDVTWCPEPERCGLRLRATAVDGAREWFWIKLGTNERVEWLDEVLRDAFAARPSRR